MSKTRLVPLAEALLVTFLWSTSYILIEIGLEEIDPLTFAAYRYTLASVVLIVPILCRKGKYLVDLDLRHISVFLLLGFTGYFVAQGLQFFGLYYLQPVTVTFILNLTPVFVLILSALFLKEMPSSVQLVGIALTLSGVLVFFYEGLLAFEEVVGIALTLVSGIGWATYMIISRYYLRGRKENVVTLTACSMTFGASILLGTAFFAGSITAVSANGWVNIIWLSVVNTALAFVLWNHALKTLRVYEQSILQNTMLIQITLLAYIFLHEPLILRRTVGMVMVFVGVLIVQLRSGKF